MCDLIILGLIITEHIYISIHLLRKRKEQLQQSHYQNLHLYPMTNQIRKIM